MLHLGASVLDDVFGACGYDDSHLGDLWEVWEVASNPGIVQCQLGAVVAVSIWAYPEKYGVIGTAWSIKKTETEPAATRNTAATEESSARHKILWHILLGFLFM